MESSYVGCAHCRFGWAVTPLGFGGEAGLVRRVLRLADMRYFASDTHFGLSHFPRLAAMIDGHGVWPDDLAKFADEAPYHGKLANLRAYASVHAGWHRSAVRQYRYGRVGYETGERDAGRRMAHCSEPHSHASELARPFGLRFRWFYRADYEASAE